MGNHAMTIDHTDGNAQTLVPASDAPMMAVIERIVMDPSIPIDRLERMLAMKERMEDRAKEDKAWEAQKAYFTAMSACQTEIPVVRKKQRNTHTNSNYADLAAIEAEAMPIIHRHGFAVSFQPDGYNTDGALRILWEISHSEGHVRNGVGEIPVDGAGSQGKVNKTGTQAFGSTATYGRRYLLCMLFNISTGDDNDGNKVKAAEDDGRVITDVQVSVIQGLIDQAALEIDKFCEHWKIEALPDIPSSKFTEVVASLRRRIEFLKKQTEEKSNG